MTKEEAIKQLEYADGSEWVNDEYLYNGLNIGIECIEKVIEIEQIISEYENCTDVWKGQDTDYVVGRIIEVCER